LLASLAVVTWLACWSDGCAYGPVSQAWWALPARDEWGTYTRRWPVQPLCALLALILFGILDRARGRLGIPGLAAALAVLGLSLEMLGSSFLRADPSLRWQGLRLDAWGALVLTGVAGMAVVVIRKSYFKSEGNRGVGGRE
jgi:hypothetical protein